MDMVVDHEEGEEGMEDVDVNQDPASPDPNDPAYAYSVGGYSVSVMEQQIPFLGQLVAAPILILATTLPSYTLEHYGYSIAVGVVGLLLSAGGLYLVQFSGLYDQQLMALPVVGPCSIGYTLCLFLFAWWAVAAGMLTFSGPFEVVRIFVTVTEKQECIAGVVITNTIFYFLGLDWKWLFRYLGWFLCQCHGNWAYSATFEKCQQLHSFGNLFYYYHVCGTIHLGRFL